MSTETLSIRISAETKAKLEKLAEQTKRSKSFLAAEAVNDFVDRESSDVDRILAGIADARAGRVVDGDAVKAWLQSWGTKKEKSRPR